MTRSIGGFVIDDERIELKVSIKGRRRVTCGQKGNRLQSLDHEQQPQGRIRFRRYVTRDDLHYATRATRRRALSAETSGHLRMT